MSNSARNTDGNVAKVRYRWQMVNTRNPKACVVRPARPDAAKQDLRRFVQENELQYRYKRRDDFDDFEDLFGQLRLNEDEELLDRAERRDLPASVQLAAHRQRQTADQSRTLNVDLPEGINAAASESRHRNRAVPNRRSAVPDTLYDDYAYRLYNQGSELRTRKARNSSAGGDIRRRPIVGRDNSTTMTPAKSYLSLVTYDDYPTAAAVNRTECLHCDGLHTADEGCPLQHPNSNSRLPDLVVDDAFNRTIRQSPAAQVCPPQPPFGIPNSPTNCFIHTFPQSDYLRVPDPASSSQQLQYRLREPVPDITLDDLAFRTLRKDYRLGSKLPSEEDFWQGQILCRSASTSDLPFRDLRITLRPTAKPSSSLASSSAASNSSTAASPTFDSSSH